MIFWLVASPFVALWLFLLIRYTAANKRWFVRFMEREVPRSEAALGREAALLARLPQRPLFFRHVINAGIGRGCLGPLRPRQSAARLQWSP